MGGRTQATMVLVQYIFEQAFQHNKGGYAATVAVALFVIVVAFSVLQFQAAARRGATMTDATRVGRSPAGRRTRRIRDLGAMAAHPAHRHRRRHLVLPALLGARHQLQARGRGRSARHRACCPTAPTLDAYVYVHRQLEICRSGTSTRSITSVGVTVLVVVMAACCGYAHLAAAVSRAGRCSGG